MKIDLAQATGRQYDRDVPMDMMSAAQVRAYLTRRLKEDYPGTAIQDEQAAMVHFGFLAPGDDLESLFICRGENELGHGTIPQRAIESRAAGAPLSARRARVKASVASSLLPRRIRARGIAQCGGERRIIREGVDAEAEGASLPPQPAAFPPVRRCSRSDPPVPVSLNRVDVSGRRLLAEPLSLPDIRTLFRSTTTAGGCPRRYKRSALPRVWNGRERETHGAAVHERARPSSSSCAAASHIAL